MTRYAILGLALLAFGTMGGLALDIPLGWSLFYAAVGIYCLFILGLALRLLWLPIQYLRHRYAVKAIARAEEALLRSTEDPDPAGAVARVQWAIKPTGPDPREVPWWRW